MHGGGRHVHQMPGERQIRRREAGKRGCEVLSKVAATYREWEAGIARGLAKNEFGVVLSNAKMEAGNDVAKTMIDAAYGYRNFERFRKRFLLMRWNAKR